MNFSSLPTFSNTPLAFYENQTLFSAEKTSIFDSQDQNVDQTAISEGEALINEKKTPQELLKTYSSEDKQNEHEGHLYHLTKSLRDPDMDYTNLMQSASKIWQIEALSYGIIKNPRVQQTWNSYAVENVFEKIGESHQNHVELQSVINNAKNFVLLKLQLQKPVMTNSQDVKETFSGLKVSKDSEEEFYDTEEAFSNAVEKKSHDIDAWIDAEEYNECKAAQILAPKQLIKWDDFLEIIHSGIAIRHTSDLKFAETEMKEGTRGDALCISKGIASLIYHLFKEKVFGDKHISTYLKSSEAELLLMFEQNKSADLRIVYNTVFRNVKAIFEKFTDQDKKTLLAFYEQALREFIFSSVFKIDNPIPQKAKDWKQKWEEKLSTSSTFIVIKKSHTMIQPYDQENYFYLGKLGRGSIQKEELKELLLPPTQQEIQVFQQGIEDVTQQILAIEGRCVDKFLKLIFEAVHK